jgi:formylmethanofuran dehydrogenase subunit B
MPEEIQAVCPFCSLHCADLRLKIDEGRLLGIYPACALAETSFLHSIADMASTQISDFRINASLEAARISFQQARQPVIVLTGNVENQAVSSAVKLAQRWSAVLTCEEDGSGSTLSLSTRTAGSLSASLGELSRLDMAVLCGLDSGSLPPRLGDFLGNYFNEGLFQLDRLNSLESIRQLRLALRGDPPDLPMVLCDLATRINAVSSGLLLFGLDWIHGDQALCTELLLWLKDLNQHKRWVGLYLPPASNSFGVVETLLAETGYPGNLRFRQENIEYSPYLWQVERLLKQGWTDLCVVIGQPSANFKEALRKHSDFKTILVSPETPDFPVSQWLPCARPGFDAPGLLQRMDGVPLEVQSIFPSRRPAADALLAGMLPELPL